MAASVALRSSSLRAICRISIGCAARNVPVSSVRSTFVSPRTSIPAHPLRLLRRELSSLRPIHSAIASACLVSELPAEASSSIQENLGHWKHNSRGVIHLSPYQELAIKVGNEEHLL